MPLMLLVGMVACEECRVQITAGDLIDQRGRDAILRTLLMIAPMLDVERLQWITAKIKWDPMVSQS